MPFLINVVAPSEDEDMKFTACSRTYLLTQTFWLSCLLMSKGLRWSSQIGSARGTWLHWTYVGERYCTSSMGKLQCCIEMICYVCIHLVTTVRETLHWVQRHSIAVPVKVPNKGKHTKVLPLKSQALGGISSISERYPVGHGSAPLLDGGTHP